MNIKKIITGLVLFPIVALLLIFSNEYIIDIMFAAIALMSLHEFYKAFDGKAKPVKWIGYIAACLIAIIHIVPHNIILKLIGALIPISILLLFAQIILKEMSITIIDIAITFFGICYIVIFLMFMPIIREDLDNGRIILWYVLFTAWGTDTFAYFVGKLCGKHKFTKISPNKTVEGCIGGTIGAIIITLIYTFVCNKIWGLEINYIYILVISFILSLVGQIGDLAASSIKRYANIKDYSDLIPGHGGMLDRIDSIIFIAPFAYLLLSLI